MPITLQLNLLAKYLAGPPKPQPTSMIASSFFILSLSASSFVASMPLAWY